MSLDDGGDDELNCVIKRFGNKAPVVEAHYQNKGKGHVTVTEDEDEEGL